LGHRPEKGLPRFFHISGCGGRDKVNEKLILGRQEPHVAKTILQTGPQKQSDCDLSRLIEDPNGELSCIF
jgi:hypothetical protein